MEKVARLIMRLDAKIASEAVCSTCGDAEWNYGEATVFLRQAGLGQDPDPPGMEAFPLICTNCGYIRFYSVPELEVEPNEESH